MRNKRFRRAFSKHGRWPSLPTLVLLVYAGVLPRSTNAQITESFTEPYETVEVAAAESGVLTRLEVKEGQVVRRGQLLGELNNETLKHDLRLATLRATSTSRIKAAEAVLDIRRQQKESIEPLLASGHANPNEVKKATSEFAAAQAELELAREEAIAQQIEADRIESQLGQRTIRSPIEGVVTELHRRPGEFISSAEPKFATIVQLDRLRVRFYLTDKLLHGLRAGQTFALATGEQRQLVEARIDFVSPVTEPESGTARVDFVIDNTAGKLRSGLVCRLPSTSQSPSPHVETAPVRLLEPNP